MMALLSLGCQAEIAKWQVAQSRIDLKLGNTDTAIENLREAVEKVPRNSALLFELAEVLSKQGDPSAIEICDDAMQYAADQKNALKRKTECLQNLGKFEAALATYKQTISDQVNREIDELNGLAYYRALADRELDLAANDIDIAIEKAAGRWYAGIYLPLTVQAAMSNGIVSRRLSQQDSAIQIISAQITQVESEYFQFKKFIPLKIFTQIQSQFPLTEAAEKSTHIARDRQETRRSSLASLLTVRALLYQDLGRESACNADRIRVKELGYDAQVLASQLPPTAECLTTLHWSGMFLDTRGFVLGLLPWADHNSGSGDLDPSQTAVGQIPTEPANLIQENVDEGDGEAVDESSGAGLRTSSYRNSLKDMDLAVASIKTLVAASKTSIFNTAEQAVEDVIQTREVLNGQLAALLHHRSQIHVRGGNRKASESDRAQIRKLGFDPDSNLF